MSLPMGGPSARPPLQETRTNSGSGLDHHHRGISTGTSGSASTSTSRPAPDGQSTLEDPSLEGDHHRLRRASTNSALLDDPLSHPHSVSFSSQLPFSTSLVREQSLALGHIEQRHTLDLPSSFSRSSPGFFRGGLAASPSWGSHGALLLSQGQNQQQTDPRPQSLGIRRPPHLAEEDGGLDRASPPSGLSLLLKTNKDGKKSKGRPEVIAGAGAGGDDQDEEDHEDDEYDALLLQHTPLHPQQKQQEQQHKKPHSSLRTLSFSDESPSNQSSRENLIGRHARVPSKIITTTGASAGQGVHDDLNEEDRHTHPAADLKRPLASSFGMMAGGGFLERLKHVFGGKSGQKKGSLEEREHVRGPSETDRLLPPPTSSARRRRNGSHGSVNNSNGGHEYTTGDDDTWHGNKTRSPWNKETFVQKCVLEPIGFIPAVILGLLLNLLDAVSYGMIIFPLNQAPFQALGPDGISMFFVSCVISQLVYSLGGSAFKGGAGGMMIEVVPFLHLMAETVVSNVGAENREAVLATTIMAYALSTLMTGAVFMSLGYFKLGSLIAFFPRHILVGCIGGVGWFLIITGVEISSRMTTELTYSLETFKFLFLNHHVFALWFSAFSLALLLRALQYKIKHPFLIPIFFMVVPGIFYLTIAIARLDWDMLRANGWIFPMPQGNAPGWQFYSFYDLSKTNWTAILDTVPAMMALTFFGILHVPINVPALGVSTGQDNVDINRELVAHGWSNLLSGCFGSVQNYLVYTNSLLFIKSGGDSRVAGVMLAAASLIVFFIGPWIVGYIPVMVVGALIFHLGMDLVKEALWDTWGLVHPLEYLTIALIVVFMAGLGFVQGILLGILLACVFFVVTNSRKEGVRYVCTGESAKSTVRRVYRQQKFLRQVGRQIYIFKLQGDMFFGTINKVEKAIQDVFSRRRWEINPIQFLVLDFSLVRGVDFSAAEGFGRIRKAVRAKGVCLVLAGLEQKGDMGKALQMVGVWGAGSGAGMGEGHGEGQAFESDGFDTQTFPGLSEALEFCENCLLESFYKSRETALEFAKRKRLLEMAASQEDLNAMISPDAEATKFFTEEMPNSPRKSHLFEAARETLLAHDRPMPQPINLQQPVPTLLAAFHDTRDNPTDFFLRLSLYFVRRTVLAGTILWRQGGLPTDGIYLVESGTLRSVQEFQDSGMVRRSVEVILPGTISGEIGLFTGNNRSSTVVSETDGIIWGLSQEQFQKMVKDDPSLAVEFMRVAMSYSAERLNTMVAYAFSLS